MQKNIDNLIISISSSLKEFAEGRFSFKEAKEAFRILSGEYESIVNNLKKTSRNSIQGLCYYHNAENYSILTGIYGIDKNDIFDLAFYGEKSLNSKVMKKIFIDTDKADKIEDNNIFKIQPDEKNEFPYNIYLFLLNSGESIKKIFASVSSSAFFSEDKFLFMGKFIKNVFSLSALESQLIEINYFPKISDEIESFLKDNIDETHSVQVILYVFNMLETILSHSGTHSLFEASDEIINVLKDNYRHNSKCYVLSTRDYLVVKKINKNDFVKDSKSKLSFFYKNMNLPYHSLKLNMDKIESIHSLWDQIMTFENYLATGDITR